MRRVVIESPYGGDRERNVAYARLCLLDALQRGEAPVASHLLYTQVLDDDVDGDCALGLEAGWEWIRPGLIQALAVYEDLGVSRGMQGAIDLAWQRGVKVERRRLPPAQFTRLADACASTRSHTGVVVGTRKVHAVRLGPPAADGSVAAACGQRFPPGPVGHGAAVTCRRCLARLAVRMAASLPAKARLWGPVAMQ